MKTPKKPTSPLTQYLQNILEVRRVRNRRYSMRAFARDLNVNPARLSEIFSLKYAPSHPFAEKMVEGLKLENSEREHFIHLVDAHNNRCRETSGAEILTDDAKEIIVDYDHYSLLNLMTTDDYKSDPEWMAVRLGISEHKANELLKRLILYDLVQMDPSGHYRPTNNRHTTTHDIPSDHLKEAHNRLIAHASKSLLQDPVDLRDISSITFALDPSCLPEAKELIRDFRRKLATLFENGPKKEVYNLNIQLVPVTK